MIRYSGSAGTAKLSFSPKAWKLFHSAMTLVGWTGISSLTSASGNIRSVGIAAVNMSPSQILTRSPSRVPKRIVLPSLKRTQWFDIPISQV